MSQHSDILVSSPKPQAQQAQRFHDLRMQFNSAFLAEDFAQAEAVCLKALEILDNGKSEIEELNRYFRMLGKGEKALDLARDSLTQNPGDSRLISITLDLLLQLGYVEEYEVLLRDVIDRYPDSERYYQLYHDFLISNSRSEELAAIAQQAAQQGIEISHTETDSLADEDGQVKTVISDACLQSMLQLFAGRENAYARQWANEQGASGYSLVNEPLTPAALKNHLQGSYTLGMYQLDSESKVGWIVFDLDISKEHRNELLNPEFKSWVSALLLEKTGEIAKLLSVYQIPCSIESSGYKGYHVWVFLEQKTSANLAKAFAERIAAQIPMDGLPLQLEVFPKQSTIKQGYGNLVKLPYGIHRLSGKLSTMLDDELEPHALSDFMASVKRTDPLTFIAALDSLGYTRTNDIAPIENLQKNADIEPLAMLDPLQDIEWLCLKQHCHALSHIEDTINTKRNLGSAQKNILRYTVGYLKNGPSIVNRLLSKCSNADTEDYMKSAFKGNAMGCAKIRNSLAAEIDLSLCNCSFDDASASYPNPLLHLAKRLLDSSHSCDLNELKLKDLVDKYLRSLKNHQEITRQLKSIESQILKLFEHSGIDHINTDYGVLSYGKNKDELTLILKALTNPEL